jgi:CBS domain-containing protein
MATVSQLLATKGQVVHTIHETATVFDAIGKMVNHNVGALVVMSGLVPVGMLTERDYLRKIALQGRSSRTTLVKEVMSDRLVSVELDTEIEDCMALMTEKHIRHLPVFAAGRMLGVVSIGDIVKHLANDRKEQIEHLTAYIQGVAYA